MNRSITYASILTTILAVLFIAGNPGSVDAGSRAISTFPYLLAALPIPLLVGALVFDTARGVGNAFSFLDGARVGERASRWAALAFAVIVAVYALGFFSASPNETPLYLALWGAMTAFLGTYMLGIVSAVASSLMITAIRRREGAS